MSESSDRISNLIDGRLGTFWGTGGPQRPGNWIQILFPESLVVARVELSLGDRPLRNARELRLEGRTEDAWIEIPYVMGRAGVQGQVVDENGPSQLLVFEPTLLEGLRLFQTGHRTRPWSIAELRVDTPSSRP